MATRQGSGQINNQRTLVYTWSGLLNGDVGNGIAFPNFTDKSVQVKGTWGTGGAVQLEGSNDSGTTWYQLNGVTGSALSLSSTAPGGMIGDSPLLLRPAVTAGDGTTSLTVMLVGSNGQ